MDNCEDCEDKEKLIIKRGVPPIDLALIDYNLVGSVHVLVTEVVLSMYKKGIKTFIGVKERLLPREAIQVGNLGILYRVIGEEVKVIPTGGSLYRLKRVDGYNITSTDIDAVKVGDKVLIKSRKPYNKLMYPEPIKPQI